MSNVNCSCAWNPDTHAGDCPVRHHQYLADLASKCQGIAGCLSYDESSPEGDAKRALKEAQHALDSESIIVHKKAEGLLIRNALGNSRYMTFRERLAFWLLGNKTEIRP